jgi:hypothetical protein
LTTIEAQPPAVPVHEAFSKTIKMHEMAALCFPLKSVWKMIDFDERFNKFAQVKVFHYNIDSCRHWRCKCFGKKRAHSKSTTTVDKMLNTIKIGCTFEVKVTNLRNYPKKSENGERQMWMFTNSKGNGEKLKDELLKDKQMEQDEMYVVVTYLPKEPHNLECTIV